ncbi:AAA family ATPase [Candidatus Woesearchaeota archaeon]|nr:AAA family ATPase [Candidatus Woesearchaeota archaeon]
MEKQLEAKYLETFLKSLSKIDEATFKSRVSGEHSDFANWISKTIKDEQLAKEVDAIKDKGKLIDFLGKKVEELEGKTEAKKEPEHVAAQKPREVKQELENSGAQTPGGSTGVDSISEVKYLRVFIMSLGKIDDATFHKRVNDQKNDFADWIIKTVKDEQLAKEIEPIRDKQKLIEYLQIKISQLEGKKEQEPKKKAETKEIPKRAAEKTLHTYLSLLDSHSYFTLRSGQVIKSLGELNEILPKLENSIFYSHVTPHKNDFASWIYHCIKDEQLANQIGPIKDKNKIIEIVKSRVQELQQQAQAQETKVMPQPAVIKAEHKLEAPEQAAAASEKASIQNLFYKLKQQKEGTAVREEIQGTKKQPPMAYKTTVDFDLVKMSSRDILEKLNMVDFKSQYIATEEHVELKAELRKGLKTGVPGFDELIFNGIPSGSTILLSGGPGSGKTTFSIQMLGWAAERGEKCLFMTFEESEDNLIEHMEAYGLNPRKYIEEGTLVIQKQDPYKISRIIEALLAHARGELLIDVDQILNIVPEGFKPDRVVLDSLSAISSAFSESDTAYRIYVNQLINILERVGATSFLISEVQGIENIGHGLVEEFLADGVIVFYNLQKGNIKQNALEILKMRAANHEKKIVPFEFVSGKGIIVYPLEKIFI